MALKGNKEHTSVWCLWHTYDLCIYIYFNFRLTNNSKLLNYKAIQWKPSFNCIVVIIITTIVAVVVVAVVIFRLGQSHRRPSSSSSSSFFVVVMVVVVLRCRRRRRRCPSSSSSTTTANSKWTNEKKKQWLLLLYFLFSAMYKEIYETGYFKIIIFRNFNVLFANLAKELLWV